MEINSVTVVLTSCGRVDLLEKTLDSFFKRSLIWKDYEDNIISLSVAREKSNLIEKNIEIEKQKYKCRALLADRYLHKVSKSAQ